MLDKKIKKNKEIVGIFGLGYIGLPLALNFSKKLKVYGFDIDKEKIKKLSKGQSYLSNIECLRLPLALQAVVFSTQF